MRLDHLIATVPDLRATHRLLLDSGFEEAWPPGPFWPQAITSGIAIGGVNLELYQPLDGAVTSRIETLVLAPDSRQEGFDFLHGHALGYQVRQKVEPDPELLSLRGFSEEMQRVPQEICFNQLPVEPPYPFFFCSYAPYLRDRLAPGRFRSPRGLVTHLVLASPEPEVVRSLFAGALGEIRLDVVLGDASEVLEIRFEDGAPLVAEALKA